MAKFDYAGWTERIWRIFFGTVDKSRLKVTQTDEEGNTASVEQSLAYNETYALNVVSNQQEEMIILLHAMIEEQKKTNFYLSMITEVDLDA